MTEARVHLPPWPLLPFVYDDGGRAASFFKGTAGDCVTRAVAIATGLPYLDVYDALGARMAALGRPRSARNGVAPKIARLYLRELGWEWTATMSIGSGCRVHLRADELPAEPRLIVRLSRHVTAVVDGVLRDTHDCSRDGTRCVYGFWAAP